MDVYERLAQQLDEYSVGFPRTASGVEMEILKRLFTPQEADLYLNMTLSLESPEEVAERTKIPLAETKSLLEGMYSKGLLFMKEKGEKREYGVVPFMVGFYEFQLKDMDKELATLFERYFEEAFLKKASQVMPPLRTVPVKKVVETKTAVLPYEDLKAIIGQKEKIAVAKCICRVQKDLVGKGCDKPLEVCFSFGSHAEYYVKKGMARYIDQEEALKILSACDEAGLVPQPYNAQNPGGICNCCGDCCGMLLALKAQPKPSEVVYSNYWAKIEEELCIGCETCLDRCQMEAISIAENKATIDLDRCIGCGLCVTTCPTEAASLILKPQQAQKIPPLSAKETMMTMAQLRGKSLIPISFRKRA